MIIFKNFFLLLFLSVAIFSQESIVTSEEVVSTDFPEELIGNKVESYESINTQKSLEELAKEIEETVGSIDKNTSIEKESIPPTSQYKEEITPTSINEMPTKSFNDALNQAKEEHKTILLEVYETNCKFCQKMESKTFSKKSIIDYLGKNFVLIKINADKQELPLGLKLQMTPMHVFITENEDIKDMTFGFLEEKDFLELLEREKK